MVVALNHMIGCFKHKPDGRVQSKNRTMGLLNEAVVCDADSAIEVFCMLFLALTLTVTTTLPSV